MSTRVTQLLLDWRAGNSAALDELMPLVDDELHRVARTQLASERSNHTLQPTALVHEAYLRLVDHRRLDWQLGAHFLAMAATTMRRILVSYARKHRAAKRGGAVTVTLREDAAGVDPRSVKLIALDEASALWPSSIPEQEQVPGTLWLAVYPGAGTREQVPAGSRYQVHYGWYIMAGGPLTLEGQVDAHYPETVKIRS